LLSQPKAPKGGPPQPTVPQIIALGRSWLLAKDPDYALSQCQRAALEDGNCVIIFSVPLTPNANPIEYWWGTAKGDLGRMYDGTVDAVTITRRWRDITIARKMQMHGATSTGIDVEPNSLCSKYVQSALLWAQLNLVPHSALVDCGELGNFDLSKAVGAEDLHEAVRSSAREYYRLWKETEDLSLAVPDALADPESESEGDDFVDAA